MLTAAFLFSPAVKWVQERYLLVDKVKTDRGIEMFWLWFSFSLLPRSLFSKYTLQKKVAQQIKLLWVAKDDINLLCQCVIIRLLFNNYIFN